MQGVRILITYTPLVTPLKNLITLEYNSFFFVNLV